MVITIEKKEFIEAIHTAARFAERRSATLPALSGIAIVAANDQIKLRATNLETGIDLTVPGSVRSEGVIVVPAALVRDIASSLTGSGSVTIEHAGDAAVLSTGAGKSTLKTLSAEDFPGIPFPEVKDTQFTIEGTLLKDLIGTVVGCASASTVRPELASVFLSGEGGTLKAVASDSFRLAEKKRAAPKTSKPFSVLVPAKNAADILQTLPDDELTITLDEHQCAFSWPTGTVTTRLVAATYPDYTQIIPKSFTAEATILKKDFEAALRRTAVFSDSFQKIKLMLLADEKKLSLSSKNTEVGESSETIPASVSGESLELSFNHRYLSTPLPLIASENLSLQFAGIGRPLVMCGAGDASFLYLVMPMNQ